MNEDNQELKEELDIDYLGKLAESSSWRRRTDGKIIVGFIGELSLGQILKINNSEIQNAKWLPVKGISKGIISAGTYGKFIIKNSSIS